jgi:cytochrome c oxidase subunit 1
MTPLAALQPLQRHITISAIVLALAQLIFLVNLVWSLRRGKTTEANPWRATTLEWAMVQHLPVVSRGPYEYRIRPDGLDFLPQNESETGAS